MFPLTNKNQAPSIIEPLSQSDSINESEPVKFECRFTAYPRADVVWLKDNVQIDLNMMGLSKDFKVIKQKT